MRVPSGGARCASARAARPAACRIACCRAWGPVLLLWRHAGGPQPASLPACTRLKVIHASFGLSVCLLAVYNTMRLETYAKVGAMTVTMHAAGLCARRPRAALLVPDAGPRCDSDWHGGCDLPSPCCMCLTLVMQRACVLTVAPPPDPGRSHAHHLQRPRARLISRSMHACPLLARQPSVSPRPCTVALAPQRQLFKGLRGHAHRGGVSCRARRRGPAHAPGPAAVRAVLPVHVHRVADDAGGAPRARGRAFLVSAGGAHLSERDMPQIYARSLLREGALKARAT